jgi:type IV secretory pathway VirB9-like protein
MRRNRHLLYLVPVFLCSSLLASETLTKGPAKPPTAKGRQASESVNPAAPAPAPAIPPGAKIVQYGEQDVVPVKAKIRYSTLIVLPKNEQILDYTCGDKEFWIVNGSQNFAYVKPAKPGSQTNLNLITASGNIYSFVLAEVSQTANAEPDLKVFIEPKEESMIAAASGAAKLVSAQQVEGCRQEVEKTKEEVRKVKESTQTAIDSGIAKFLANVRFPYRFEAGRKPFFVRAMYHDDKSTFIQARPEEPPALYELKDGKPNLVNFDYRNGAYVVDKILEKGYLAIGKQKLAFSSQE